MRLQVGELYELNGKPWRCVMVNDCRARIVPDWKETRTLVDGSTGEERTFKCTPRGLDVSPNSDLRKWRR